MFHSAGGGSGLYVAPPGPVGVEDRGPGTDSSAWVWMRVTVSYGKFDVYSTEPLFCQEYSTEGDSQVCEIPIASMKFPPSADRPSMIEYRRYIKRNLDKGELLMVGTYRQVALAFKDLKYRYMCLRAMVLCLPVAQITRACMACLFACSGIPGLHPACNVARQNLNCLTLVAT